MMRIIGQTLKKFVVVPEVGNLLEKIKKEEKEERSRARKEKKR